MNNSNRGKNISTAPIALGLIGIALDISGWFILFTEVFGIVLGIVGLYNVKNVKKANPDEKMTAATVINWIAIALGIIMTLVIIVAILYLTASLS